MRHFLEISDLDAAELAAVLDRAEVTQPAPVLAGRGVALVFEKPSARTRNATEMAVFALGGLPVTIRGEEVGFDVRETVEDVTRVLAQYHAAVGARVFDHRVLERMAALDALPVINLLSDRGHPCQALADLLTLRRHWGSFGGRSIAWVGDGNNVLRSLALGAALCAMPVRAACPPGYLPDPALVAEVEALGGQLSLSSDPAAAVGGADAVYTDVWTSMGQEAERTERLAAFEGFTVDEALMTLGAAGAVFLHCLPAHRGEEVAAEVIDGPRSLVWPQAANRMHSVRGLLWWMLGGPGAGAG
jgi:ornithine carbamoyltransferase